MLVSSWFYHHRAIRISNISAEQLGVTGAWKSIIAQSPVSEQAKLHRFQTTFSKTGEVHELSFHLVERGDYQNYIHSRVSYDTEKQTLTLQRSNSDQWLQYDQEIAADYFFERLGEWKVLEAVSSESSLVKLQLMQDTLVNYNIKDRQKFAIDENGLHEITDDQLPVKGYWLSACETTKSDEGYYSGCDHVVDYLLDVMEYRKKD